MTEAHGIAALTLLEDLSQLKGLFQSLIRGGTDRQPREILSRGAALAARANALAGPLGLGACTARS